MKQVFRNDIIMFGSLAGILGNIPKTILDWIYHYFGWVRYTFSNIAAGYFVQPKFFDSPFSMATGFFVDFVTSAFFGVAIYYLLRRTGMDYAEYKGFFVGSLLYVVIFGTFMSLDLTRASLLTPLPNFLMFFPHALFGITTAWIIKKYGVV